MKRILLCFTCILFSLLLTAQKKAVTESGEEVILYENGTWKFVNEAGQIKTEIPVNPAVFKKSSASSFLVKSNKLDIGVWLDPKKWSFKKSGEDDVSEYDFELKGKDLYAMLITESIEIPLESLKTIALENAKEAAPDIHIVKEEYRTVNGKKMLYLQMDGSAQGIKLSYCGYYYSDEAGTVQFVTYTAQSLLSRYMPAIEEILNGMARL